MHPLVAPVVDALEALAGWTPPGPGQLIPDLEEFLPGLVDTLFLTGAAMDCLADALDHTPVSCDVVDILREMRQVSTAAGRDDVWERWQDDDAADIARADRPRTNEADYNVGDPTGPATAAAADSVPAGPWWCTGVVACQEPGCGKAFSYELRIPAGFRGNAEELADNAAQAVAYDDHGWHIRPGHWHGCPDHPGGPPAEVQIVCQWQNGDHYCYASHIATYPGVDSDDRVRQALHRLQEAGWHIRHRPNSDVPNFVGCPQHPHQHAAIDTAVLDRYPDSDLARHLRSGEAGRLLIGTGKVGRTSFVDLADGTTVIEKRTVDVNVTGVPAKTQQDAEELASAVLRRLGLRAPEVVRVSDDTIYMNMLPGTTPITRWIRDDDLSDARQRWAETDYGRLVGAADLALDNWDRNAGNWLIDSPEDSLDADAHQEIGLIDHGVAFYEASAYPSGYTVPTWRNLREPDRFSSPYVGAAGWTPDGHYLDGGWADNPLHPDDAAEFRRRLETTRPEFERLGRLDWYDFMIERADAIKDHAAGTERIAWPSAS